MPTTTPVPSDVRRYLLDRVGYAQQPTVDQLVDPNVRDVASPNLDFIWNRYAGYGGGDSRLRQELTVRDLIDLIEAQIRRPDVSGDGKSVRWTDRLAALETLRKNVQAEIDSLTAYLRGLRPVVAGVIAQTSPAVPVNSGQIGDPLDSRLRGDPFARPFFPWGLE